jgi:hypothetical protein
MLCGSFIEINKNRLDLKDVDGKSFCKAINLFCGQAEHEVELDEVRELACRFF